MGGRDDRNVSRCVGTLFSPRKFFHSTIFNTGFWGGEVRGGGHLQVESKYEKFSF